MKARLLPIPANPEETSMPDVITAETVLAEHDDDIFYCGDEHEALPGVSLVWTCVRPDGHGHDHAAVVNGVLVATWPQEANIAAQPEDSEREVARLTLDEMDPRLTWLLRTAGDEWGPLGVARAASLLANPKRLNIERAFAVAQREIERLRVRVLAGESMARRLDEIRRISNGG